MADLERRTLGEVLDRASCDTLVLPLIDFAAAMSAELDPETPLGPQLRIAYEDAWVMGGSEALLWLRGLSALLPECGRAYISGDLVKARELDAKLRALADRRAASGSGPAQPEG